MVSKSLRAGLALAAVCLASFAHAQGGQVQSRLSASQVTVVDGKQVLKPATQAKPGDVVAYTAVYTNNGASSVGHLTATVPVPAGTTYIAGSASPASAVQASTDGTHFAPMPLMHEVRDANGKPVQKPVLLADYRALQWEIPTLSAHADATVSLHVRVNPPASAK